MIDIDFIQEHKRILDKTLEWKQRTKKNDWKILINDPFYHTEGDVFKAKWFSKLWNELIGDKVTHLRGFHYKLISLKEQIMLPDIPPQKGHRREKPKQYINTEECYQLLNVYGSYARYLGLIHYDSIIDNRNPSPSINLRVNEEGSTCITPYFGSVFEKKIPCLSDLAHYESLYGYQGNHRYHIEIWIEKSTMNYILQPLCELYDVNLQVGIGELSVTAVKDLMLRLNKNQPCRIMYISDFDPAGRINMPSSVSRKIEFMNQKEGYDIKLQHIMLTEKQCEEYDLPLQPLKEGVGQKSIFYENFKRGATELDSLEALHPNVFKKIVKKHILQYFDEDLGNNIAKARYEQEKKLKEIERGIHEKHKEDIDKIKEKYDKFKESVEEEMESIQSEYSELNEKLKEELEEAKPELDDMPKGKDEEEIKECLYDSSRNYKEQLKAYREFRREEWKLEDWDFKEPEEVNEDGKNE